MSLRCACPQLQHEFEHIIKSVCNRCVTSHLQSDHNGFTLAAENLLFQPDNASSKSVTRSIAGKNNSNNNNKQQQQTASSDLMFTSYNSMYRCDLYIRTHYWVLYDDTESNLSIDQLQAQQDTLNIIYNRSNFEELATMPDGFSAIGNPQIHFMPHVLVEQTDVTRLKTYVGQSFASIYDVLAFVESVVAADIHPIMPHVLNVYIVRLNQGLLGQAVIRGNTCCVQTTTVGGKSSPGASVLYGQGKSLVHEIAHCFGLLHVFVPDTATTCTNSRIIADIPRQTESNDTAIIVRGDDGVYRGQLSNRRRDCNTPNQDKVTSNPPYSCAHIVEGFQCDDGQFENFSNFLDYAVDEYMLNFTHDQVNIMISRLLFFNNNIAVYDADGRLIPNTSQNIDIKLYAGMTKRDFDTWLIAMGIILTVTIIAVLILYSLLRLPE